MVNTDLPASTPRGRRTSAAFKAAAHKVLARDGFAAAKVADIAAEATHLAGPSASWFDDPDHVPAVVATHLVDAMAGAGTGTAALVAAWWDACSGQPDAVAALVALSPPEWEPVRVTLAGHLGEGLAADARTEALVAVSLRWLRSDTPPPRADALATLAHLCS